MVFVFANRLAASALYTRGRSVQVSEAISQIDNVSGEMKGTSFVFFFLLHFSWKNKNHSVGFTAGAFVTE